MTENTSEVEPEVKPAAEKPVEPVKRVKRHRETASSRSSDLPATMPSKILDVDNIKPFFEAMLQLDQPDAWIKWMFRHDGKFDKATASIVITIYRKLKSEGFE